MIYEIPIIAGIDIPISTSFMTELPNDSDSNGTSTGSDKSSVIESVIESAMYTETIAIIIATNIFVTVRKLI